MTRELVGNLYGLPVECLQRTTADDDAHVERQVSLVGGDNVDHGDDPHDIRQPKSEDITQLESEDIAQPEASTLPVLKENEVWTIRMFRPINMYMYVYIYVCRHVIKFVMNIYFH
jgi:hypothetical protein